SSILILLSLWDSSLHASRQDKKQTISQSYFVSGAWAAPRPCGGASRTEHGFADLPPPRNLLYEPAFE
ncbi:MAG: hypothetical protein WA306_04540, partial [Candidatus Acidiferrales bacterium]